MKVALREIKRKSEVVGSVLKGDVKHIWFLYDCNQEKIGKVFYSKKNANHVFGKIKNKDIKLEFLEVPLNWAELGTEKMYKYWQSQLQNAPANLCELFQKKRYYHNAAQIRKLPINGFIGAPISKEEPMTWRVTRYSENSMMVILYREFGGPDVVRFKRSTLLAFMEKYKRKNNDIFLLLDFVVVELPIRRAARCGG